MIIEVESSKTHEPTTETFPYPLRLDSTHDDQPERNKQEGSSARLQALGLVRIP
jgi:hypothetical protein